MGINTGLSIAGRADPAGGHTSWDLVIFTLTVHILILT